MLQHRDEDAHVAEKGEDIEIWIAASSSHECEYVHIHVDITVLKCLTSALRKGRI